MSSEQFDAIVVGGGPAGALSALLLARRYWRVGLIERKPRHRVKTCGYCLNPRVNDLLRHLDLFDETQRLASGLTEYVRIHVPQRAPLGLDHCATSSHSDKPEAGLLVDRTKFDQLLIDAAATQGVDVFQPGTARIMQHDQHKVDVNVVSDDANIPLRARLLVGADGLRSTVAKAMGLADNAASGRCFGFSFNCNAESTSTGPATMEMFLVDGGYIGVVQHNDGSLHVGGLINTSSRLEQNIRKPVGFVRHVAQMHPMLHDTPLVSLHEPDMNQFTAAGPMPWRPRQIAGRCAALVGDEAGYVEPFTGEGMAWALESAQALDDAIATTQSNQWNMNTGKAYQQIWQQRIGGRQRWCAAVATGLQHRNVLHLMFRLGRVRRWLAQPVVRRVVRPCA